MGREQFNTRITIIMAKDYEKLDSIILESAFPFSKRMCNMLGYLEVTTIRELAAIPLNNFQNIRGFKTQCRLELIAFIEFENLENLFDGFSHWKEAGDDYSA